MGRIMKYEIRKSRTIFIIMAAMLTILEVSFLIVNRFSYKNAIILFMILINCALITYVMVLVNGVSMFSRDMREKSGYMVYMTPVPVWQIILGKILVCFISGSILFALYVLLAYLNLGLVHHSMLVHGSASAKMFATLINNLANAETFKIIIRILISVITSAFALVNAAYLSISIGNTVLRGKKGERAISFAVFIIIMILIFIVSAKIGAIGTGDFGIIISSQGLSYKLEADFFREIIDNVMNVLFGLIMFIGSSYLIKNKIDL
jgi:hypothetical protein